LLFKRTTFRETIETRRAKAKTPPEPVNRFSPSELERKIDCPVCTKRMGTYQYLGPGNIVIDTCHGCDLIWLDYGELTKVVNAPGRDRGVPRKKLSEIEKEEAKERNKKTKLSALEQTLIDLLEAFFS
jgi:Zn-finger nucleic acid-binding protein